MNTLYAFLFLAAMGGIYAMLYALNRRVPVPEGCEDLKTDCDGCRITTCGSHPVHRIDEGDNEHA